MIPLGIYAAALYARQQRLGVHVPGIAVPGLLLRLVPAWFAWIGLAIAGLAELSFLAMVIEPLQFLIPIGRFGSSIWLITESRCVDEGCPAVVLGCGGDRLVLGGELTDVRPCVLFGGDGLVGGEFGADVLEDAEQHRSGGGFGAVARVGFLVGGVGLVDGDIGEVRVAGRG